MQQLRQLLVFPNFNLAFVAVLVSFLATAAAAQSLPITGSHVPELAGLDQIIINWLEGNQFQTATLAVVKDRRLVYSRGYGWQDASRSVPIRPDAVMRLASNSKPVTAAAIRLLATRGQLSLNAKVYDLLQIPPSGALGNQHHLQYTVQQVLDHVAGLAGGAPGTGGLGRILGLDRAATLEEAVAYMWTRPLGATPGTYSYSNWGYQLLGAVIEKVSGMSYDEYVKTQLMAPIQASTFAVGTATGGSPNEIWYQSGWSTRPEWDYNYTLPSVPAPHAIDMETRPAAGSLISSAPDYCRFLNAYYHTGTAKPVSLAGIGWGYGFYGSLPGTWTISNEHISAAKGQIVFVILLNQRIEGDSTSLPELSTSVRNFLHGIVTWPDHDFFVSPLLSLDRDSQNVLKEGGAYGFGVEASGSWSWTLSEGSAWISSSEPASQNGNQTFSFTVAPNAGSASRTAKITLTDGTVVRTHTIKQARGGPMVAWGGNNHGQTEVPAGLTGLRTIGAGDFHSVALKNDGTVVAWGWNAYGQTDVPAGLSGVIAVAAGNSHTLALKSDGTVVAWGRNNVGQTNVPAGLNGVIAIAAATVGHHSMALKSDGKVIVWGGDNFYGAWDVPDGLQDVKSIAAGSWHLVALKIDGTVVAWGSNTMGQSTVPSGLTGVIAIAAAANHTVALKSDGKVVVWGSNVNGQRNVPGNLSGVTAIATGSSHLLALKNDGTLVAWGGNTNGQSEVPAGLGKVAAIAAGGLHSLVLLEEPPAIRITGNLVEIASGDLSPSQADRTDFGPVITASGSRTGTFTITNVGGTDLNLTGSPRVVIAGSHAGDFTVSSQPASPISPGASTTFDILFDPAAIGLRSATVRVSNDDLEQPVFTFAIKDVGVEFPPVIHPVIMPDWYVGQPTTDFTITVTHGATKFKVTGLPPGVKVDAKTGQFSGRPTKAKMVKKAVVPYTVTITATNAAGAGEPYTFEWLVEPLAETVLGSFYGTVQRDESLNGRADLDHGLGGFVLAKVASSGAVSGSLKMAGINLPFRGGMEPQSDGSLELRTELKRKRPLDPLELSLTIAMDGTLSGYVTDGTATAELDGWKMNANPERTGSYNVVLDPGSSSEMRPSGSGFAVVKVSAKGTATIKGRLADGTALTGSSAVAANGKFPWHQMLYKNTGSVQGVLTFGADSITGGADWNKAAQAKASPNYMDGFTLHDLAVSGGRYVKPARGEAALGLPSALLVRMADGGLEDPYLWLPVTLTEKNTLVAAEESAGLKIKLAAATGLFTGTFMVADLDGGKPRKMVIAGALIPGEAAGMGYFLLPSSSVRGAALWSGQVVLDEE